MQEHQDFKNRVLGSFRKRAFEYHNNREGLAKQVDLIFDSEESRARAGQLLVDANQAQTQWSEKRQHGYGKFGKNTQDFATNFADFIKVYGGFVDVVRQAGGVYAEVAYSTLSLFFVVSL